MAISSRFEARFVGSFPDRQSLPKDRWPQVAVAGRSNVGKSSLLNKLLARKGLAKVSGTPGKTRLLNFFAVNERFYLVDLPGYGYARVSKSLRASWGRMIEDYLTTESRLAGLLLLIDCRREITPEDRMLLDWLTNRSLPVLVVLTKTDKLSRGAVARKVQAVEAEIGAPVQPFSTTSGLGKREVVAALNELIGSYSPEQTHG